MPSWFTHLATAKELIDRIEIKDINSFLIGNLMPDAERYVIKDFSICVPYDISHFASIQNLKTGEYKLPDINKFLNIYEKKVSNPLVLGYLVHLLTDYYWNQLTFSYYTIKDQSGEFVEVKLNNGTSLKCSKILSSRIKHADFAILEESIIQEGKYILPHREPNLISKVNLIKEIPYNESDIEKIIDFCEYKSKNHGIDGEYKLFTKDEIEKSYKKSIEFIYNYLNMI